MPIAPPLYVWSAASASAASRAIAVGSEEVELSIATLIRQGATATIDLGGDLSRCLLKLLEGRYSIVGRLDAIEPRASRLEPHNQFVKGVDVVHQPEVTALYRAYGPRH